MATLAEARAMREELSKARSSGLSAVSYSDGSSVTYKSDAAMRAALADLDRQIAELSGTQRISVIRISSNKGL